MTGPGGDTMVAGAVGEVAAEHLKNVLLQHIKESHRTHRILIVCCSVLIALAAILPVVAPEGRQTPSVCVSLGLVILALGSIGVASFRLRAFGAEIDARKRELRELVLNPDAMNKNLVVAGF